MLIGAARPRKGRGSGRRSRDLPQHHHPTLKSEEPVKVGPITAQYKGKATFLKRDKDNWTVVIKGDGRDARGAGNASALITAALDPVDDAVTKVNVNTDLTVTGKVAQFGRGAMAEVSTKLMSQFAENLESLIEEGARQPPSTADVSPAPDSGAGPQVRRIDAPVAEAVDLLAVAGTPILKRVAVPVLIVVAALIFWWLR